jgi:hypothetical protein
MAGPTQWILPKPSTGVVSIKWSNFSKNKFPATNLGATTFRYKPKPAKADDWRARLPQNEAVDQ